MRSRIVWGVLFAAVGALAVPTDARRAECAQQAKALVRQMSPEERISEAMMDSPAIPRLGIPRYHWWNEALHGVARAGLATVFPQSIGMAATFDPALMKRVGDVVSTEARAKYNLFTGKSRREIYEGLTFWSPNVNMFRDPRWGRGQETFGEDPFLSGEMGKAYVEGLQGDDLRYLKVAACAKHFAAHSGPEALRHGFDAKVSPRDLAEYYLPAFKKLAVEAKVEAFMGAYSAINGTPCCANKWLLTDLLRGAWGFKGHIVSDVMAVADVTSGHHFASNRIEGCRATLAAGLDLCSEETFSCLREKGALDAAASQALERALVRLFTTRALLGQFDPPGSTPWDALNEKDVATPAHRALALEAAEKSIVLVANNGILPLDTAEWNCIGVVGPRAEDEIALFGNYCGYSDAPVTAFSGIVGEAGAGVRVWGRPEEGADGEVFIACLGLTAEDEGEEGCTSGGSDRVRYALPEGQLAKLREWRARGKKIVSVIFGGSPFDLSEVTALSDAVLLAWYPGEQGGRALARVIFGKVNPSGRLPITFPKSYDDLPDFTDYSLIGRTYRYQTKPPAYPFGYGLSYTTFAYEKLKVEKRGDDLFVSVDVKNAGRRTGEEVVQFYVRSPESARDRRRHHLEGIARVSLKPGEAKRVELRLAKEQFATYDDNGKSFIPEGKSMIFVGGGQPGFAPCLSEEVVW